MQISSQFYARRLATERTNLKLSVMAKRIIPRFGYNHKRPLGPKGHYLILISWFWLIRQSTVNICFIPKKIIMPGFEHGTSRVKSDQFANWATTIWILSDKLVSNNLNVNVIWIIYNHYAGEFTFHDERFGLKNGQCFF